MKPPARPTPVHSPLFASIITRHGLHVADEAGLDDLAREHEHIMLVLAGDAERLAESDDVAVIVPELAKAFAGILTVVVATRDSERTLQRRFRFQAFPALVFLRDGQYLGAMTRVHNWADYLREIPDILGRQPSDPPPFKLPGARIAAHDEGMDGHHDHSH